MTHAGAPLGRSLIPSPAFPPPPGVPLHQASARASLLALAALVSLATAGFPSCDLDGWRCYDMNGTPYGGKADTLKKVVDGTLAKGARASQRHRPALPSAVPNSPRLAPRLVAAGATLREEGRRMLRVGRPPTAYRDPCGPALRVPWC
jgi:hypothetical protein